MRVYPFVNTIKKICCGRGGIAGKSGGGEQKTEQRHRSPYFTAFCIVTNGLASLALIFLNKIVYREYHFPNLTLTCIHFVVTAGGLEACRILGWVRPKRLPFSRMVSISVTFCGFVVFTNLSLQNNTVGTYQILKTMTIPGVLLIQTFFYKRKFSLKIRISLIPIILGVFLNSYFDLSFNPLGVVYGVLGVLVTSLYQVWVGAVQHELDVSSAQLLYYQAPLSATAICLVLPFYEPLFSPGGLFSPWPWETLILVGTTGLVAFAVNLSIFWLIGNTSPLTYNVVGQFKFCLTLLGGFILFKDPVHPLQVYCGIALTVTGVFSYTYFKLRERQKQILVTDMPFKQALVEVSQKPKPLQGNELASSD